MKKILSLLGASTLIGTSTTSLVACNTPQYSEDELKKEKEKNNININGNILEWMAPQEKPFDTLDNKYYFVVWRGSWQNNITDWRIIKFKHDELKNKTIDSYDIFKFNLTWVIYGLSSWYDIGVENPAGFSAWWFQKENIKSVYRWSLDTDVPNLDINNKTGVVKVN